MVRWSNLSPEVGLLFWVDSVPLTFRLAGEDSAHAAWVDDGTVKGDDMPEQLTVKCPSCGQTLAAADESRLIDSLHQHLQEKHAAEMPQERVRENVAAQLRDFDGYNARPISGA